MPRIHASFEPVPCAGDAEYGERVLIAVINQETGRQITNMYPGLISPPLIQVRCAGQGFPWHDRDGLVWEPISEPNSPTVWRRVY